MIRFYAQKAHRRLHATGRSTRLIYHLWLAVSYQSTCTASRHRTGLPLERETYIAQKPSLSRPTFHELSPYAHIGESKQRQSVTLSGELSILITSIVSSARARDISFESLDPHTLPLPLHCKDSDSIPRAGNDTVSASLKHGVRSARTLGASSSALDGFSHEGRRSNENKLGCAHGRDPQHGG